MSTATMIFKSLALPSLALAAAMLWSGPAQANLNCPPNSEEYNGQCWSPNPSHPNPPTTPSEIITGAVGVGTGIGMGGGATIGDVTAGGGAGGAGGHGGVGHGGNASAGGGRAQQGQKQDQYQQASAVNGGNRVNNQIDASSTHNYEAVANSIILGSAYAGEDECKVGFTAGGSTVGAQVGGGLNAIDKSCAVVRQMMRERVQICGMFGPQSRECASATYHTSAIGALAMTESGRVVEKSGPRVGVVPAKARPSEPTIVRAWNQGEARRSGIDACRLNPSKCE